MDRDDQVSYAVEILASAQNELEDIALLYLMLSGLESAENIMNKILDAVDRLSRFPLSGPYIRDAELRDAGYHFLVIERYILIYRLINDQVFVYHIFDGRSDYLSLFRNELQL